MLYFCPNDGVLRTLRKRSAGTVKNAVADANVRPFVLTRLHPDFNA
jgi:hypothetical protein